MSTKEIRKLLLEHYPDHTVKLTAGTFKWLHRTATVFENRTAPCVNVEIKAKAYTVSLRTNKRLYNHPEGDQVLHVLRSAGYCAEYNVRAGTWQNVSVIDAEEWPIHEGANSSLGRWHQSYQK